MADIKIKYAATAAITISLAGKGDGLAQQSTEIDNGTNLYDDALLRIKTNGQTGGSAFCEVYLFSSTGDTVRSGGAGASDANFTPITKVDELRFLGVIPMKIAVSVTVILEGVASAFGGILPEKWGIVVLNKSGAALHATGGEHDVDYQGIHYQTI